jgi:O-antigen ligase
VSAALSGTLQRDLRASVALRRATQYAFMGVTLMGSFSIARVVPSLESLGVLGEPRFMVTAPLLIVAIWSWIIAGPRRPPSRQLVAWLIAFVCLHALVAVSYSWSLTPDHAERLLTDLGMLVASTLVFVWLFHDEPTAAGRVLLHCSFALSLPFLALVVATDAAGSGEISLLGAGGIGAARLFGVAVIGAAIAFLRTRRPVALVAAAPIMLGMLMSGSRAAVLGLVLTLGVLWWWRDTFRDPALARGGSVPGLSVLLAVIGAVAILLSPLGEAVFVAFAQTIFRSSGGGVGEVGSSELYLADRDRIFSHAFAHFADSPLGGLGIGSYTGPFGEEYPHNLFLSYAVDAGGVAVLGAALLIAWPLLVALRLKGPAARMAALVAIFYLIVSQFAGAYYDARILWFFLASLLLLDGDTADVQRMRVLAVRT